MSNQQRANRSQLTWTDSPQKAIWDLLKILQQPAAMADLLTGASGHRNDELIFDTATANQKALEIAALLGQAEEYFKSAESSTLATRPLQLYYGALALAKALIISRDKEKFLINLKYHGLDTRPISSDSKLYSEDKDLWNLFDEYANVNDGVFKEFARVFCRNEVENKTKVTLRDLMRTDAEIAIAFNRFGGCPSYTFPLYDISSAKDPYQLRVNPSTVDHEAFFDNFDFMRDDFSFSGNILHNQSATIISKKHVTELPSYLGTQWPSAGGKYLVGPTINDSTSNSYIFLEREVADYASLFILSTLVRYRSELWFDIIRGERNGNLGLIGLHLNAITRRWPLYALRELYSEHLEFGTAARMM